MEKLLIIIICYLVTFFQQEAGLASSNDTENISLTKVEEVHIGPNVISMPLGKILVVRKGSVNCALKFTKFWSGKNKEDRHATYESYCPEDKSGRFSKNDIKIRKEELYFPKASWFIFGHPVAFGTKDEIHCGPFNLWWSGKGSVYFFEKGQPQGDYGIELAPTKWTDISQVNVFDPRLKWFKYDENRDRMNIPVDDLWKDN